MDADDTASDAAAAALGRDQHNEKVKNLPSGPPGAENDHFEPLKKQAPLSKDMSGSEAAPSQQPSKRRSSRSESPRRRRRSRSTSSSAPTHRRRRYDDHETRNRSSRRSRSRDRHRSPPRRGGGGGGGGRKRSTSRDRSRDRYRSNRRSRSPRRRGGWSPNKKGPVSPPPSQPSGNPFGPPPTSALQQQQQQQTMYDGYGSAYGAPTMAYGNVGGQYGQYDYSAMQQGPPPAFNSYVPPPAIMQPIPPGDEFQQQQQQQVWGAVGPQQGVGGGMIQMTVPPPQQTEEEKQKRDAAVAAEKQNQRATLRKQRDDYKRRSAALKRELIILKEQRGDLLSGSEPPSPTTKGFLKENDRLQLQIENKIKTIENVIEMLTSIIGNDESPPPPSSAPAALPVVGMTTTTTTMGRRSPSPSPSIKMAKTHIKSDEDSSPERLKSKVIESLKKNRSGDGASAIRSATEESSRQRNDDQSSVEPYDETTKASIASMSSTIKKINFVHYDPEMHWCKTCQEFPKTAKDYLTHLHSKEHQEMQKTVESPWHEKPMNDEMPTFPDGQTKRTPIRGLQFFVPTTGWYCRMCNVWMGDLHCASLHLKSQTHAVQYHDYTSQNPHFEIDWMSDRQKAYELKREMTAVTANAAPVLDGIPLQIQQNISKKQMVDVVTSAAATAAVTATEADEKKKKKKEKKERRERKKKKRSKRRKHSSSTSHSSDSSDSEPEANPNCVTSSTGKAAATAAASSAVDRTPEDGSQSIRVAMRNLLKQQAEKKEQEMAAAAAAVVSGGKWTVVQPAQLRAPAPPPPTISENGAADNKKDELMISQWNAPPASVITEKEKKMLEQLKGKMAQKTADRRVVDSPARSRPPPGRATSRERNRRSRSRDRGGSRDRGSRDRGGSRGGSRGVSRDRSRDRDRRDRGGRRSRSPRGYRRSPSRSPPGRWSGRRRSRSRSHGRRIEKPIVRYPEFRPRIPTGGVGGSNTKDDKKRGGKNDDSDATSTKKTVMVLKKPSTTNTTSNKKLPFIGRMPVFKKQTNDEEARKEEADKLMAMSAASIASSHIPAAVSVHNPMMYAAYDGMHQMAPEDYDDLMPDPMQFVSLMGAPPPPPMVPPPPPSQQTQMQQQSEPVLPPGIDDADADAVIKTISDAPLPRKGPLPQDFQDALSIIFPGEKKPDDPNSAVPNQQIAASSEAALASIDMSDNASSLPQIDSNNMLLEHHHSNSSLDAITAATTALNEQHAAAMYQQQQQQQQHDDSHSQMNMDAYGTFSVVNGVPVLNPVAFPTSDDTMAQDPQTISTDAEMDLMSVNDVPLPTDSTMQQQEQKPDEKISEAEEKKALRQAELNDLAMLGIDADDMAAQCIL